jgi:hypothetical protein
MGVARLFMSQSANILNNTRLIIFLHFYEALPTKNLLVDIFSTKVGVSQERLGVER